MGDDIAYLITEKLVQNDFGVMISQTATKKEVFVEVVSIRQDEFFRAGAEGLKPDLMLRMFMPDYDNEQVVEYGGRLYAIYRTFFKNETIELYLTKKGGVCGDQD
jgi:SPP1 family predicted phage head-tail adaptor